MAHSTITFTCLRRTVYKDHLLLLLVQNLMHVRPIDVYQAVHFCWAIRWTYNAWLYVLSWLRSWRITKLSFQDHCDIIRTGIHTRFRCLLWRNDMKGDNRQLSLNMSLPVLAITKTVSTSEQQPGGIGDREQTAETSIALEKDCIILSSLRNHLIGIPRAKRKWQETATWAMTFRITGLHAQGK